MCQFRLRRCVECGRLLIAWHSLNELTGWLHGLQSGRLCEKCLKAQGFNVSLARQRTLVREDN